MSLISQSLEALLWPMLALVVVAAAVGMVLRHPRFKGWWGDQQVRAMLRTGLNPHLYVDLHNVTVPLPDGGSTQIDHLLFSPYGVFVLETQRMQGWIYGSPHQAEWTQKIHPQHSQKFQNPLRQNYLHTQAVQVLLQLPAEHVHAVVVFMGDSQFQADMPPHVTQGKRCIDYILRFQQEAWGPEVMQELIDRMEQLRLHLGRATQQTHETHVRQTRKRTVGTDGTAAATATGRKTAQQASSPAPSVTPEGAGPGMTAGQPRSAAVGERSKFLVAPSADATAGAAPRRAAPACPQCQSALRRMRLQRGPLAGQVVYRCSNTALCHYVQPLSDNAAA